MRVIFEPTNGLYWFDLKGEVIQGPRAWQACHCWLPDQNAQCFEIEGQTLSQLKSNQTGVTLIWPALEPGYYSLVARTTPLLRWLVFVSARYLNEAEWIQIFQDLRYQRPLQNNRARGGQFMAHPARSLPQNYQEEVLLLEDCLLGSGEMGFFEALHCLSQKAKEEICAGQDWVKIARLKHMPATLLRRPLTALPPHYSVYALQNRPQLDRLHGFIHGLVQKLKQRLLSLIYFVQNIGDLRALRKLEYWQALLKKQWAHHPLSNIPPLWQIPQKFYLLLHNPPYRACYRYAVLEQSLLPSLNAQNWWRSQPFALLYQAWCAQELVKQLCVWGEQQAWQKQQDARSLLRLQHQTESLTLFSEKQFAAETEPRAVTRPQRPDLALRYRKHNTEAWMVIEVKFRMEQERAQKSDLDKIHAYRDALRDLKGEPQVILGVLLYPGPAQDYSPYIQAWQATPQHREWPLKKALDCFF